MARKEGGEKEEEPSAVRKKEVPIAGIRLAEVAGFEPTHTGVKVPCLTAWRHPNMVGFPLKYARLGQGLHPPLRSVLSAVFRTASSGTQQLSAGIVILREVSREPLTSSGSDPATGCGGRIRTCVGWLMRPDWRHLQLLRHIIGEQPQSLAGSRASQVSGTQSL